MALRKLALFSAFVCCSLFAGSKGSGAEYAGGTILQIPDSCSGSIQAVDDQYFVFYSKKARWRVPYERINLIEYGQKVDRRYMAAVLISPLFLMSKKRRHFLTVGYTDEEGHQQAMIFRVEKPPIRTILATLEAPTAPRAQHTHTQAPKSA